MANRYANAGPTKYQRDMAAIERAIEVAERFQREYNPTPVSEATKQQGRDIEEARAAFSRVTLAGSYDMHEALQRIANLKPYGDGPDDIEPDGHDAMQVLNWHIFNARRVLSL